MSGGPFSAELVEERDGLCVLRVSGKGAFSVFANEPGGHRWQGVSGKKVHTSTITVAVLPEPREVDVVLKMEELDIQTCRGSGPGGQHRNKRDTAVQIKHKPTGIIVRCDGGRSQSDNKETALSIMRARLWQKEKDKVVGDRDNNRKYQVGSGMRGDKRRTIRTQDDVVTDHVLNRTWRLKDYLRGNWD